MQDCEKERLVIFFASPIYFDIFNCQTKTSNCFDFRARHIQISGQTDSQLSTGWFAKRTLKIPRYDTQVTKKIISRQTYPAFHWLIIGSWTSHWKTCIDMCANLIATKVSASQCKCYYTRPGQMELQVDPSFQLAHTCKSVWPGLYIQVSLSKKNKALTSQTC